MNYILYYIFPANVGNKKNLGTHTHKHTKKFSSNAAKYLHIHFYRDDFLESGLCAIHFDSPEARQIDKGMIYIYISASKLNLKAVDQILLIMSYGFGDVCALSTQIVHLWIILYTIYQHMHTNTLSAICNVQTHEWLLQPSQTNISWITLVSVFSWFTYTLSTIFLTVFFWCSFESNQGATLVLLSDALQLAALSAESAHGGLKPCRAWTVEVCKQLFGEWGMVPINSILDVCIYIKKCIYIYTIHTYSYTT